MGFYGDRDTVRGSAARLSITRNADRDWFVPLFFRGSMWLDSGKYARLRGNECLRRSFREG